MNLLSEFWKDRRSQFLTHCQVQMVNQQRYFLVFVMRFLLSFSDLLFFIWLTYFLIPYYSISAGKIS